jgi:CheY-like chemotaxis protein
MVAGGRRCRAGHKTLRVTSYDPDISMPGHDGWWLVREAERLGYLAGVPRLAVSALDLKPEEIRDGGFDAFLRKPVDPQALCNTVQALARGRKGSAPAR